MRDTVQSFSAIRDVSRMLEVFNCLPKVGRNIFEAVHEVGVEPWKKDNKQLGILDTVVTRNWNQVHEVNDRQYDSR